MPVVKSGSTNSKLKWLQEQTPLREAVAVTMLYRKLSPFVRVIFLFLWLPVVARVLPDAQRLLPLSGGCVTRVELAPLGKLALLFPDAVVPTVGSGGLFCSQQHGQDLSRAFQWC